MAAEKKKNQPGGPAPDPELFDSLYAAAAELHLLYHYLRWTLLTGAPPAPGDWEKAGDWPTPADVEHVFGSWKVLEETSGIAGAKPLSDVERREKDVGARVEELERGRRKLEAEAKRVPELRRQVEQAKRRRDEATEEAQLARARLEGLERELDSWRHRAVEAERAASAAGERDAPADRAGIPDEWLAGLESALADAEASRGAQHDLQARLDTERAAREDAEEEVRRLRRAVAEAAAAAPQPAAAEPVADVDAPPRSAVEAVERAAASSAHLRFAPRAFESAADSPFRHPRRLLEALRRLDELAELYGRPDGIGRAIGQAAEELGLNWAGGVSTTVRERHADAYSFPYEGRTLDLGPHVKLGSGSGASFIARIYLHLHEGDDELERAMIVGHVGRHLPDTTT